MHADETPLTHVDDQGRPAMVDVSSKAVSSRSARARCLVEFPPDIAMRLRHDELRVAKGAVVDTAIIAGTMAVKRTAELIPFCHPLALNGCDFRIDWFDATTLGIDCSVRVDGRTGVEMEALTGAAVAGLTVYDMCKALSHAIVLREVRLVSKQGGKRDVEPSDAD
jgi:cyclic pyranopterin phosphate synthase